MITLRSYGRHVNKVCWIVDGGCLVIFTLAAGHGTRAKIIIETNKYVVLMMTANSEEMLWFQETILYHDKRLGSIK